jgi:hypothetical protein
VINNELLQHLNSLCNDQLTRDGLKGLQDLLLDDPIAQQQYFDYVDLHLGLKQLTSAESVVEVRPSEAVIYNKSLSQN